MHNLCGSGIAAFGSTLLVRDPLCVYVLLFVSSGCSAFWLSEFARSRDGSGVPPTFSDLWCLSSGAVKHFPDKPLSYSLDCTTAHLH
jgi:hypothetical protein